MFKIDGPVRRDEPMAPHCSFRIGGPADLYVAPAVPAEAAEILRLCAREGVPSFILGGGTNILVADRGIRGVVLDLARLSATAVDGTLVSATAGAQVSDVAELAVTHGLTGMEFAYSLPGSLGGAVWMNARCYGGEVSDVLEYVEYLDGDLRRCRYEMKKEDWGYKRSPFQEPGRLILSAGFRLSEGDAERARQLMQAHRKDREAKGHFLHPCAGSVFKNNRAFGAPTGQLIDSLGLKGLRIGDAQVAPYHANIFINLGSARAADMRALIHHVEEEVRARLGFRLEREVILVGDWE